MARDTGSITAVVVGVMVGADDVVMAEFRAHACWRRVQNKTFVIGASVAVERQRAPRRHSVSPIREDRGEVGAVDKGGNFSLTTQHSFELHVVRD